MIIEPLLPFLLQLVVNTFSEECLTNRSSVVANTFHYSEVAHVLTIEGSERLAHNITANIFAIFLREELGYDSVAVVSYNDFNSTAALRRVATSTMINLEVWVEPNFFIPTNLKHRVSEVGAIAPPGRFGWFVTQVANVSWQTFLESSSSKVFALSSSERVNVTEWALNPHTKTYFCPPLYCTKGVFSPSRCNGKRCATLLAGDFESSRVVISQIKDMGMYVEVVWLGNELWRVVNSLSSNSPKLVLTWAPGEVTFGQNWFPVAFPPCDLSESGPGCLYEARRLVKLVSNKVEEHALPAFKATKNIELSREVYLEIINKAITHPTMSHYDIACEWLRKNELALQLWRPDLPSTQKPVLTICGIFPMTRQLFGAMGLVKAAQMAVTAVNNNANVLRHYDLELKLNDDQCDTDSVMNTFINYVLGSDTKKLVGILGPACSETVEPLVGLTKYFRTMVISYSAEGSTFSDRMKYKYFFRTIGENQHYKQVYLKMLESLGWKRIAALTEDFQRYTEYLSHLQDLMQARNYTFITHRKFTKDRENATVSHYLQDLQDRRARIIVADVYEHSARQVMCEVYKLGMTAEQGYVWFLPQWLPPKWYQVDKDASGRRVNCTTEQILKAIQGHFTLAHEFYAPDNVMTHENVTVGEWMAKYKKKLSRNDTVSDYAGYAYDAVWTYALALDKLYHANKTYVADIHSYLAAEKFAEIINETDFMGVSGRIQFISGPSRSTRIKILQWVDGKFNLVGALVPNVSDSLRVIQGYRLDLHKANITWFTPDGSQPGDGEEQTNCLLQGLADMLNLNCNGAIIVTNVFGFGLLAVLLIVGILFTKYRYDRKVEKYQLTEKYIKSIGVDLLSLNLSDMDKWEIPRDCVVINRRLGEGAFGTVYGGEAYFEGQGWVAAAVKALKVNSTTEQKLDFLSEAEVMKRFQHENIVKLLGVCTREEPVYTVMEFMLYGDLKTFLLNRRHLVNARRLTDDSNNEVSNKKLTTMALDIARGLSYLSSLKYVHRDIACRNCLLNQKRVAKIGDFGLTRPMYESDYYKFSRKGMLPIRWMAPESLADGLFTPSSDVWSFGVVLYEMVTFGSYPFQGMTNNQVMEHVKAGNTIQIPNAVKPQLECLIKSCWNLDYKKRPAASEIVVFLANNPRLLAPCLDVPASSVVLEESEDIGLNMNLRPSVPASPLEPGFFFSDVPVPVPQPQEAFVDVETSPPASPTSPTTSFFPDNARELLLPDRRPVHIAMTPLAPLASRTPSDQDLEQGASLL